MELQKNVYEALKQIETIEQLENFMRIATIKLPRAKNAPKKINLYNYCSKAKNRPMLSGVFHDIAGKVAVATDAHLLIVSPDDYIDELDGILAKDGSKIDLNFPNWRLIVNEERPHKADMFEISEDYKQKLALFAAEFKAKLKSRQYDARINVQLNDITMTFKYEFLVKFLEGAKYIGATEIMYKDETRSIIAKSENGGVVVLMPMRLEHFTNTEDITEAFRYNN